MGSSVAGISVVEHGWPGSSVDSSAPLHLPSSHSNVPSTRGRDALGKIVRVGVADPELVTAFVFGSGPDHWVVAAERARLVVLAEVVGECAGTA